MGTLCSYLYCIVVPAFSATHLLGKSIRFLYTSIQVSYRDSGDSKIVCVHYHFQNRDAFPARNQEGTSFPASRRPLWDRGFQLLRISDGVEAALQKPCLNA